PAHPPPNAALTDVAWRIIHGVRDDDNATVITTDEGRQVLRMIAHPKGRQIQAHLRGCLYFANWTVWARYAHGAIGAFSSSQLGPPRPLGDAFGLRRRAGPAPAAPRPAARWRA